MISIASIHLDKKWINIQKKFLEKFAGDDYKLSLCLQQEDEPVEETYHRCICSIMHKLQDHENVLILRGDAFPINELATHLNKTFAHDFQVIFAKGDPPPVITMPAKMLKENYDPFGETPFKTFLETIYDLDTHHLIASGIYGEDHLFKELDGIFYVHGIPETEKEKDMSEFMFNKIKKQCS